MGNATYINRIAIGSSGSSSVDLYTLGTATYAPPSGATSATFTNIPKEPDFFVVYVDTFNIEQWHRAGVVVYDGEKLYGQSYYTDTDCNYFENAKNPTGTDYRWTYSYSGTTLTISTYGTEQGGYFHNPGNYTLRYGYKDEAGTVAIAKGTANTSGGSALDFSGLLGRPVWFNATLCMTVDAQNAPANTWTYINESGYTHMTNGSTSTVEHLSASEHYSYTDGTLALSAGSEVFYGDYSIIYAYEPQPESADIENMTFNVMSADKFNALQATGQINENEFYLIKGGNSEYLPVSGGAMEGALTLNGDPTENLHAATKQYVDNLVGDVESLLASL